MPNLKCTQVTRDAMSIIIYTAYLDSQDCLLAAQALDKYKIRSTTPYHNYNEVLYSVLKQL